MGQGQLVICTCLSLSCHLPFLLPPDLGHEHPQGNGGTRKKSGRPKEPKPKTLRLKHTYLSKDRVLGCSLNTSSGQVVNFKFSIEYDKPKEIYHNFVREGGEGWEESGVKS